MSYRQLENVDEKILNATIEIGSRSSSCKPSTKAIATECGISEFVIYDHFSTKDNLIAEADKIVIEKVFAVEDKLLGGGADVKTFWNKMVDFYITSPFIIGWTLNFSHLFPRCNELFNCKESEKVLTSRAKANLIKLGYHLDNDYAYYYTWMWIYRNIVTYAALSIYSGLADFPAAREGSFALCFTGLNSFQRTYD